MASPIYATPDELAVYITGDPDATAGANAPLYTTRLRSASRLVTRAIESAVYTTDADNLPTDAGKRDAVREATCEQASAWLAADLDPAAGVGQVARRAKSKSLSGPGGTASVTYEDDAAQRDALLALASGEELTPAAWDILVTAGLVSNRVTTIGRGGRDVYLVGTEYDILTGALRP